MSTSKRSKLYGAKYSEGIMINNLYYGLDRIIFNGSGEAGGFRVNFKTLFKYSKATNMNVKDFGVGGEKEENFKSCLVLLH